MMSETERLHCLHKEMSMGGTDEGFRCKKCNQLLYLYSDIQIAQIEKLQHEVPIDASEELKNILTKLYPEWRAQFVQANSEYSRVQHLGPKGVMPDIHRKTAKLLKAVWDGEELRREKPREVAMDMIGHLFLLITLMDNEDGK